ncbi:hypothetical protein EVA_08402 [gut metagenome]|uniref:Uncharacterized protein n=1 Tax=gut metagenome TaxID=749906 RepID=J9GT63_9ZZZZ
MLRLPSSFRLTNLLTTPVLAMLNSSLMVVIRQRSNLILPVKKPPSSFSLRLPPGCRPAPVRQPRPLLLLKD